MQLSVRYDDPELERRVRDLATREGLSLNQAVVRLLRKGAGLAPPGQGPPCIGSRLDHLAGTWSKEEHREFTAALEAFETVDEEMWS